MIHNRDYSLKEGEDSFEKRFEFRNENALKGPNIMLDLFSDVSAGDDLKFEINRKISRKKFKEEFDKRQNSLINESQTQIDSSSKDKHEDAQLLLEDEFEKWKLEVKFYKSFYEMPGEDIVNLVTDEDSLSDHEPMD